jgi:hypothetical protein
MLVRVSAFIAELERVVAGTRLAPDRAPARYGLDSSVIAQALLVGASSVAVPWEGLNDRGWWTPPGRDRFVIALDFWRAADQFRRDQRLRFDIHPGQEQLFDPDAV